MLAGHPPAPPGVEWGASALRVSRATSLERGWVDGCSPPWGEKNIYIKQGPGMEEWRTALLARGQRWGRGHPPSCRGAGCWGG